MNFRTLKTRHRAERQNYPESLSLRVHRALSWLDRAERSEDDLDACYIFLWIAFNAAYANELDVNVQLSEQRLFTRFLGKLCELDHQGRMYDLIWSEFTGSIRLLLDNRYVFKPFWDYQAGHIREQEWIEQYRRARQLANRALAQKKTPYVLKIVFARLYTLRNQILHGGSTWNSSVNIDQKRDGVRLLGCMVPTVITIMMDHPGENWGEPCYPVL